MSYGDDFHLPRCIPFSSPFSTIFCKVHGPISGSQEGVRDPQISAGGQGTPESTAGSTAENAVSQPKAVVFCSQTGGFFSRTGWWFGT